MSAVRHCYSPDAPQTERLAAYLEEKEARVERRKAFARRHAGETVVQLALNIPGRIKDSALLRRLLASGMSEFALRFPQLTECALTNASAGPSALFAAAEAPQSVKEKTAELEALHPWSRLFDFDVYDAGGKTVSLASRHGMGRTCFVCSRPAALCMREKSHSAEDVAQSVTDRLARFAAYETAFTVSAAARRASALALRAALYEVGLQPKPGLVDPAHSGSHEDMDFFTFQRSAAAISSFFPRFFAAGEWIADDPAFLLAVLRLIGLEAEEAMYEATGHINTHKGLIFSLGLVLGAAGEVSAAQREYESAASTLDSMQQQASDTRQQVNDLQSQTDALRGQLGSIVAQLEQSRTELAEAQNQATAAAKALEEKQVAFSARYDSCKQQLTAMQLLNEGGEISLLMQADDLYELLTFWQVLNDLTEHNKQLLDELDAEAQALDT